jgi:hypothetical protein
MAWTAPIDWTTAPTPTAANFNEQIRDNFNEQEATKATAAAQRFRATGANALTPVTLGITDAGVGNELYVLKTIDETAERRSYNNPVDDSELAIPVGANEVWIGDMFFIVRADNATTGLFFMFGTPEGASGMDFAVGSYREEQTGATDPILAFSNRLGTSDDYLLAANVATPILFPFYFRNGPNAGFLRARWCAFDPTFVGYITICRGSFMRAMKVA